KCLAAANPQVTLMLISQNAQTCDGFGNVGGGMQKNIDIDDRFGSESWNGGAAHVFDRGCGRAGGLLEGRAQGVALVRPGRVVVLDDDRIAHSNCLRNSASCCCISVRSARRRETSSSR